MSSPLPQTESEATCQLNSGTEESSRRCRVNYSGVAQLRQEPGISWSQNVSSPPPRPDLWLVSCLSRVSQLTSMPWSQLSSDTLPGMAAHSEIWDSLGLATPRKDPADLSGQPPLGTWQLTPPRLWSAAESVKAHPPLPSQLTSESVEAPVWSQLQRQVQLFTFPRVSALQSTKGSSRLASATTGHGSSPLPDWGSAMQ